MRLVTLRGKRARRVKFLLRQHDNDGMPIRPRLTAAWSV